MTVVFNGEEYLEKTIRSVTEQTYLNKEYIVIDGGSSDGTLDIIRKYEQHIDRWVSEWDKGIYDAMNKGIDFANGEWIIFMNAGDVFYSEYVLESFFLSKDRTSEMMIYGDALLKERQGIKFRSQKHRHKALVKALVHQSMFIKSDYMKRHPFDLSFKVMADYDHMLGLIRAYPDSVAYMSTPVCIYDRSGASSRLYRYIHEYLRIIRNRFGWTKMPHALFFIMPRWLYSIRKIFQK